MRRPVRYERLVVPLRATAPAGSTLAFVAPVLLCVAALACSGLEVGPAEGPPGAMDGGGGRAVGVDGGGPGAEGGITEHNDETPLPSWEKLIDPGRLHQIRITLDNPADVATLETLKGPDVPAEFVFDDVVLKSVGIHQKGSEYSGCRCLKLPCANPRCMPNPIYTDKVKPGLKVKLNFVDPSQRLFGLKRLVMNNAHQDLSFVSADIVYQLYRRADLVAPRTAFAQVVINGIPLGLYNLEEDTADQFLQRNFGDANGNLYEGSSGLDFVNGPSGPGVGARPTAALDLDHELQEMRSRDDVIKLSNTILGTADGDFEAKVSKLVDLDPYITSWAIEAVTQLRDTYSFHLNNYLLYRNPRTDRFVFLPHGDDAAFLDMYYPGGASAYPPPWGADPTLEAIDGRLAMAVQDIPALYARYEDAVKRVSSPPLWDPSDRGWMLSRIAELDQMLATMAKPDKRMNADIAQFKKYRPEVEKFIKGFGTSRKPKPAGLPRPAPASDRVPVIVSSDLFYVPTPATTDDFFDLLVLLSMPEVDVKGVILDNALPGQDRAQLARPGAIAMGQIETILRRRTPTFIGLNQPLTSLGDQVMGDEERFQGGVGFILETLQKTDRPVTLVTLGSTRDVAAAFNRQPALFRQKVGRVLVFAGDAAEGQGGGKEYNVALDHFAYAAIMKSGLPVYWVPRQDGGTGPVHPNNGGHASSFTASLTDAIEPVSGPPLVFLLNAISPEPVPYIISVLATDYEPQRMASAKRKDTRDFWAAAVLAAVADRTVTYDGADQTALVDGLSQPPPGALFGFSDVTVTVSEQGDVTSYAPGAGARQLKRFDRLVDQGTYAHAMGLMTGKMLGRLVPGAR